MNNEYKILNMAFVTYEIVLTDIMMISISLFHSKSKMHHCIITSIKIHVFSTYMYISDHKWEIMDSPRRMECGGSETRRNLAHCLLSIAPWVVLGWIINLQSRNDWTTAGMKDWGLKNRQKCRRTPQRCREPPFVPTDPAFTLNSSSEHSRLVGVCVHGIFSPSLGSSIPPASPRCFAA